MNDICFEINNMHIALDFCIQAENKVRESTFGLAEIAHKMEDELSSFNDYEKKAVCEIQAKIAEIKNLIGMVDIKISNAQSKKQQESKPPAKPSIPPNATPEQQNEIMSAYHNEVSEIDSQNAKIRAQNQRIDEFVSKCNAAKTELEDIIAKLHQLEASVVKETELANSTVHEYLKRAHDASNQSSKVNFAIREFNYVFDQVYQAAQKLYMMEPTNVCGYSYVDRLFVIKNTHNHHSSPSAFGFCLSSEERSAAETAEAETAETAKRSGDTSDELLIKERDEASFFEAAKGALRIKMPSSNLHKLGGNAFLARMNERGFVTVTQSDGSTIDLNGMIHWERKDG